MLPCLRPRMRLLIYRYCRYSIEGMSTGKSYFLPSIAELTDCWQVAGLSRCVDVTINTRIALSQLD